jgi:hypothetical protein
MDIFFSINFNSTPGSTAGEEICMWIVLNMMCIDAHKLVGTLYSQIETHKLMGTHKLVGQYHIVMMRYWRAIDHAAAVLL